MKFTNNNILIFLNDSKTTSRAVKIIKKKYPAERNNVIESASQLADAVNILNGKYKAGMFFDIIILDLGIPLSAREEFIKTLSGRQTNHEFILVTNNVGLKKEEKKFIANSKTYFITDINGVTLLSLVDNIIEKRFNEKKYNLMNRIDDIVNWNIDSRQKLEGILNVTLTFLDLKACWISLVDHDTQKIEIAALTEFGKYQEEFRKIFDISLSDESVTAQCINSKKQMQCKDVLSKDCRFKFTELAEKMELKSILVTPIFAKRDARSKVLGTLNLLTRFYHIFQDDELELIKIIAAKTAAFLMHENQETQEREKLGLIEEITGEINKVADNPDKVFEIIVEKGLKLVDAERGCIKVCYEDFISREFFCKCDNVNCVHEKYRFPDITNFVIRRKRSLIIDDVATFPHKDPKIDYSGVSSRISVPLILNKKVIGVLTAEHSKKNHFNESRRLLFETLTKHVVVAVDNAMRNKRLQKRLGSQTVIKDLIEQVSKLEAVEDETERKKYQKKQLDDIIKRTIRKTGEIFKAYTGYVVLAGFKGKFATRNKKWQFGLGISQLPALEIGTIVDGVVVFDGEPCLTGKVIAEGKTYNCPNVKIDNSFLGYEGKDKTVSEIVVPLKFQDQTFGAFALDSEYENGFSSEDEEILGSIATQMALLIKRIKYLNTLLALNKPFNNIDNLDQLYGEITDRVVECLDTQVSYLRVLDRNKLVVKGWSGVNKKDSPPLEIGEGISGRVASTLKWLIIPNVQTPSSGYRYPVFAKKHNLFAKISVPIVSTASDGKKDLIGVLNTYANRICNFTSLDLQLMQLIAEKASVAIKKAMLIKQLDAIAKIDEKLTTTTEKDVIQDIAKIAKKLLDADQVVLYRYNSNIKKNYGFSPATAVGKFKVERFKTQANFSEDSLVVLMLDERENEFFIESYEQDLMQKFYTDGSKNESITPFYRREGLKSVIILKLTYKEEVVGVLFINYRYQKSFPPEEKGIAKTFANNAAIAVSSIRKYEDIDRLHSVGNTIASESNIKKVLAKIASNAQVTLNADIVIVHRYDKIRKKAMHPPVQSGDIRARDEIKGKYGKQNVVANLIGKGVNVFAEDVKESDIFKSRTSWENGEKKVPVFIARESIESCAAILLKVRKEIVGAMFINYRTRQMFDPQRKRIIEIFANQAAIAIRNANSIEESNQTVDRIKANLTAIKESGDTIVKSLRKERIEKRDILQPTLRKAKRLINVDMGYVGVIERDEGKMKILVCSEKYNKLKNILVDFSYSDSEWINNHKRFDIYSKGKSNSDYRTFYENPKLLADYPDLNFTADKNIKSALRVPIYSSDNDLLGMIVLESEKEDAFSEIDAYTVVSLANQASLALQNYKLILQLKKLREVDGAILREQNNLDKVLAVILEAALNLGKKKYADITLLRDRGDLIIKKSLPVNVAGKTFGVDECLCGIAVEEKKTYYEENVLKNPRFRKIKGVDTKSELVIPLIDKEKPIGVLNIESEKIDDFTKEDINILEMLAGQASIAIQNAQLSEKNRKRRKELNALRDIDKAILDSKLDLSATLDVILTSGLQLIEEKHGCIILLDKDNDKLVVKKSTKKKDEGMRLEKNKWVYGETFSIGRTISNKELENDPLYKDISKKYKKSELVIPLKVDNEPIGLLNIKSDAVQGFDEDAINLLENLSGAAAIAIVNAQHYEAVEKAKKSLENSINKELFVGFNQMYNVFDHQIGNTVGAIEQRAKKLLKRKSDYDSNTVSLLEKILKNAELALKAPNEATAKANNIIFSKPEKIKVSRIFIDIKNKLNEIGRDKAIKLKIQGSNDLPTIEAYYNLLFEGVFDELIRNAIKAMPGGGQITVQAKLISEEKKQNSMHKKIMNSLEIKFSDTGCGVPRRNEAEIFTAGFSSWKGQKGKGAGLFYMKSIIAFCGGDIKCERNKRKGTTFVITFPIFQN